MLFNDRRGEIFLLVNMDSTWEGNYFCCKYSVSVAAFWGGIRRVGSVKESELEDDQILSADSAMQFQNSLQVRVFL